MMQRLGQSARDLYDSMVNYSDMPGVLQKRLGKCSTEDINEELVADILSLIATSSSDISLASAWTFRYFFKFLRGSDSKWRKSLELLDKPHFKVSNEISFSNFNDCLTELFEECPTEFFYKDWKNMGGQVSLITSCIIYSSIFCLGSKSHIAVDTSFLLEEPEKSIAADTWRSLELYKVLLKLCDYGHTDAIVPHLDAALIQYPDLVLCGMIQVNYWCQVRHDILSELTFRHIGINKQDLLILNHMWNKSTNNIIKVRGIILDALNKCYQGRTELKKIYEIVLHINALQDILKGPPTDLVMDLAFIKFQDQNLDFLKEFINDRISEYRDDFFKNWMDLVQRIIRSRNKKGSNALMELPIVKCVLDCIKSSIYSSLHEKQIRILSADLELHEKLIKLKI